MIIKAKKFFELHSDLKKRLESLFNSEKYKNLNEKIWHGTLYDGCDRDESINRINLLIKGKQAIWHHKDLMELKYSAKILCNDFLYLPISYNQKIKEIKYFLK